jgi:hypothetical protein
VSTIRPGASGLIAINCIPITLRPGKNSQLAHDSQNIDVQGDFGVVVLLSIIYGLGLFPCENHVFVFRYYSSTAITRKRIPNLDVGMHQLDQQFDPGNPEST